MMRNKLPNLDQFFGGYFHEDWNLEAKDASAAVSHYLNDAPDPTVLKTIEELNQLLDMNLDEERLREIMIYDLSCCYDPEFYGISQTDWLRWIQTSLKQASKKTPVLR